MSALSLGSAVPGQIDRVRRESVLRERWMMATAGAEGSSPHERAKSFGPPGTSIHVSRDVDSNKLPPRYGSVSGYVPQYRNPP